MQGNIQASLCEWPDQRQKQYLLNSTSTWFLVLYCQFPLLEKPYSHQIRGYYSTFVRLALDLVLQATSNGCDQRSHWRWRYSLPLITPNTRVSLYLHAFSVWSGSSSNECDQRFRWRWRVSFKNKKIAAPLRCCLNNVIIFQEDSSTASLLLLIMTILSIAKVVLLGRWLYCLSVAHIRSRRCKKSVS